MKEKFQTSLYGLDCIECTAGVMGFNFGGTVECMDDEDEKVCANELDILLGLMHSLGSITYGLL
ncbi:hypothetical protein [Bacillus paralicheniformis]|uniref:hypothetical protein n=1 Tax=Bacillus paralicheniformis TaxID=1648923 RepID=UPI0011A891BB|nr:hypothetical protein [Bacillus paralicheniformis]